VPLVSAEFSSAVGIDAAVVSVSELAVSEASDESVEPCVADTVAASAGTA
jgi:hypothetical protein